MQPFTPFYSPFAPELMLALIPIIAAVAIWTVIIKGYALWHAARNSQKGWFIALLVINTLGILEVIYLVWYRPTSKTSTPAVSSSTQA
ncbi:MAG: DUF5652 family protein [Candidatus Paceibacterota bacterium]|jgi:methionyl-tRNA synthetase